jgi:hypothetical protein
MVVLGILHPVEPCVVNRRRLSTTAAPRSSFRMTLPSRRRRRSHRRDTRRAWLRCAVDLDDVAVGIEQEELGKAAGPLRRTMTASGRPPPRLRESRWHSAQQGRRRNHRCGKQNDNRRRRRYRSRAGRIESQISSASLGASSHRSAHSCLPKPRRRRKGISRG